MSRLQASLDSIKLLVQNKLINGSKETLLGIVLIGTQGTKNILHEKQSCGYLNITTLWDLLRLDTDLIKVLEEIRVEKIDKSDWIDGLLVAADLIGTECGKKKF